MSLHLALKEWSRIQGVKVLPKESATKKYGKNTIGSTHDIDAAIVIINVEQVQAIVRIANTHKIPLYPISGGHNWGYGSATPAQDGCVILDLSGMKKILECNEALGYVTLEPGVTQGQLYEYLQRSKSSFMVPTTGAGPSGSIIGNALEKGFGVTPLSDHFGAVLTIKAVLANGEIFHSVISEFGGHRSDRLFKWKLGPFVDGLFVQGNAGIVIQATIALAKKPETMTQFLFFVDDDHFEEIIDTLAGIKQKFGSMVGGINVMNKRRLLAMIDSGKEWVGHETLPELHIRSLAKKNNLSDWVVMGGIYCPQGLQKGIINSLKRTFGAMTQHTIFFNRKKIALFEKIIARLPFPKLYNTVRSASRGLDILEGVPNTVALPLAYLKNRKKSPTRDNLSPDEDECGLIWFSPLLPIEGSFVRDFTQELSRICLSFGIEPLITLTTISERCFDATIPLLFDATDETESKKVKACYKELLLLTQEMGVFPYRIDISTMRELYDTAESPALSMLDSISKAIDPNHILAPGRYQRDPKKRKTRKKSTVSS